MYLFRDSRFLTALFCFFCFLVISFLMPPHLGRLHYIAALNDKHRRLEQLPSPRLIFVGGSNLSFGLDTALIEEVLNVRAVNMGLCSSFGPRYYLEEIKRSICPGDIVVIIPEYSSLVSGINGNTDILKALEVYQPAAVTVANLFFSTPVYALNFVRTVLEYPSLKWKAFFSIVGKIIKTRQFDVRLLAPNNKVRKFFNRQGDYFLHFYCTEKSPGWVDYKEVINPISPEAAELLNDFYKYASKRGASVLLIPPPYPLKYVQAYMPEAKSFDYWPGKQLELTILARPERYILPSNYFYEHPYHLNLAGRKKRTNLVIEDLQNFLRMKKKKI